MTDGILKKIADFYQHIDRMGYVLTPIIKSKILIISAIIIIGFTLSVIYHYCLINYLGYEGYPFSTFLFKPWDSFMDFFNIYNQTRGLDPYGSLANYFPLTFIFVYLLTMLPPGMAFFIFVLSFVFFVLAFIYAYLPQMNVYNKILLSFIFSLMSYPFLWTIDRGNMEVWGFISTALCIHNYIKKKDALCILYLSVAISLKLYPAILVILFLYQKKYIYIFYTFVVTFLLTFLSAAVLQGGVKATFQGIGVGLSSFSGAMTFGTQGLQHNTSFYAPLRLLFDYITIQTDHFSLQNDQLFYNAYYLFAMLIFGLIALFMYRYKLTLWKKVTILVLSFIVLPQISFDYKLVSLTIPLMLFIGSDEQSKYNVHFSILFGLLLIPKDYFMIVSDVSISIIINPLLIFILLCLIFIDSAPINRNEIKLGKVEVALPNQKFGRQSRGVTINRKQKTH